MSCGLRKLWGLHYSLSLVLILFLLSYDIGVSLNVHCRLCLLGQAIILKILAVPTKLLALRKVEILIAIQLLGAQRHPGFLLIRDVELGLAF